MGLKGNVLSQICHAIMTHGTGCILKWGTDTSMKRYIYYGTWPLLVDIIEKIRIYSSIEDNMIYL